MAIIAPDIGIDLGTSNTMLYVKNKGIIIDEPTLVVVSGNKRKTVKAFGEDARVMLGRTSGEEMAIHPLEDGVVKDFNMTRYMLEYFIRKAIGSSRIIRPRGLITIPCRCKELERRAVREAADSAGIRKGALYLIDKPFAAALGSGLPVFEPRGSMVVDIGGGTTDVAVISLGGVVVSRSVRVGGRKMDAAIINYIKRKFNIEISERTAEELKIDLGAALPSGDSRRAYVRGLDAVTNLPQTTEINAAMIYEALQAPCHAILSAIQYVLERTPPELAGDVMRSGIHLTGGGSLLSGLDRFIASELDMPVLLAKEPLDCAAMGVGHLAENIDLLQRMGPSVPQRDDEE